MRHYELMVVLSPVLSQEEFAGTLERIKDVITQSGGDITQEEQWGMRRLAYPIRRAGQTYLEGNYILTRFSTDTIVPRELEPHLTLSEDVLRFLVVRSEAPKPAPPQPQEPAVVEQPESGEPASELADSPDGEAGETQAGLPAEAEALAATVSLAEEPASELADSPDGEAGQTAADQPTEAEAPTASLAEESASEPVDQPDGEADETEADEPTEAEAPTTSLAEEPASELADSSDGEVGETEADEPAEAEAPTASLAEEPIVSENEASDGEESGEPQQEGPIVGQVEEPQIGEEAEEPQPAGDSASQSGQTRE